MASFYAGAKDLKEFWETVLARRCGFRKFPQQRLQLDEYGSPNRDDRDKTYVTRAAVIDGFEFDWQSQRVPKAVFEATDPVHWLALTTAIEAIKEAGVDLDAVGRERVGVILGNSLTGEVSRANLLRLRWPYVRQAIVEGAAQTGIQNAELIALIREVEQKFKGAFPVPNEDLLAGTLSNVIAGRICNALDLKGGGYVVDGACASSLLAVSAACEALTSGRLDMVVAGGVDISLDPLEMVGFARTGAVASGAMRVYDKNSSGFLPGEGCGMLVLMRRQEVERLGLKPWAKIAGWGISSDGSGGITAPKGSTQAIAMRRCYELSGFAANTLDFIEGHGTGTPVGDKQELLGFLEITGDGNHTELRRTGLTSIKTLLGHTKAAAGAAGLIKAVLAVNQRVLPPIAGIQAPADAFSTPGAQIYPIVRGGCLPPEAGLRAGVSGAGFGGINCHIAVTGEDIPKRSLETRSPSWLLASYQTAELFVASADDVPGLLSRVAEIQQLSIGMAEGERVDLAVECAIHDQARAVRAIVVAETVDELHGRLASLVSILKAAGNDIPLAPPGTLLGRANPQLRVGYLLPGQGSQFIGMGRTLVNRMDWARDRCARWDARFGTLGANGLSGFIDLPVERADTPEIKALWDTALRNTRVTQPAIVMTSLQWIQWLRQVGITPNAVAGHSLGEITAMVAANFLSEDEAIDIVRIRSEACAAEDVPQGGMLALNCGLETAQGMVSAIAGYAVVANDNAPDQVVVAGDTDAIAAIADLARERGITASILNVSKAFHSSHMTAAAEALAKVADIRGEEREANVLFFSGVHGGLPPAGFDPFSYLAGQITAPARFREAVKALAESCDILVEIGPGSVLTGLAKKIVSKWLPVCALEPGPGDTDSQFCATIGQLFVAGSSFDWPVFYENRYWRPFIPASRRKFIENPCSRRSGKLDPALIEETATDKKRVGQGYPEPSVTDIPAETSIENIIRELVARETGYELETISPDARLSRDLNLDSIKIAEVRAELRTRDIDLPDDLPIGTTSIQDIAAAAVRRPSANNECCFGNAAVSGSPLRNLPVLGYAQVWRDATLVNSLSPIERVVILHGPERAGEARGLVGYLTAIGIQARMDDGIQAPGGSPERLVALPCGRVNTAAVSEFLARLGVFVEAGIDSIVIISRSGFAPIFGFAQSLSLEIPRLPILAVEADAAANMAFPALAQVDPGVRLLRIGADDTCQGMALEPWTPAPAQSIPLQPGDVVAISGGAKGITAECTLALLRATRARALLLGTSPEDKPGAEVEAVLLRIAAEKLEAIYLQCDVTDEASVRSALQRGAARLGTSAIVGLVHGAGVNIPGSATRLNPTAMAREYAVKVVGLNNLLTAIGAGRLKFCVALGSVIGSVGMAGNGGYALANEAMALALKELKNKRPSMHIACPAYGVWSEVGMGAKLNVLEALERQNIQAISIGEGTSWFLECCAQPDIPIPLVVTAPMQGLPTWRQARGGAMESGLPFMDDPVVYEPGVALISRSPLNPERTSWLNDHSFRGTLLLPTVQALTAMGIGARLLAGGGRVARFLDLKIAHPIVATHHGDTFIELDVRATDTHEWIARVGMPGNAFGDPAFSARCQLGGLEPDTRESLAVDARIGNWQAIPAEAGKHLYDAILFQGRVFQRIETLEALDLSDNIHRCGRFKVRRERSEPEAPVPDPFFLDAMLQCIQVLVPNDQCLPIGIDEVILHASAWDAGTAVVEAQIIEKTATGYVTRVQAWNAADGALVAQYQGYRAGIVESYPRRPDAHALFDPLSSDQNALAHWLAEHPGAATLNVVLGAIDADSQEMRRATAAVQIARQLGISASDLTWRADSSVMLATRPQEGVSIAHDAARLLTVCGTGRIGCDLQRIGCGRLWGELLPLSRSPLWRSLANVIKDSDQAGAMVWAIHEALFKAGTADAEVTFVGIQNGDPKFQLTGGGLIAVGILNLILSGPSAIALVQLDGEPESERVNYYMRDIEMTFKEALPPLKSPTASVFYAWMGSLREEAMSGIRPELAKAFNQDGNGMVTNGSQLRIVRPLHFLTNLRAWVWLDRVLTSHPSTFELGFQWAETDPQGMPLRIVAQGIQRLTWVDIGDNGHVSVSAFPGFFADFIAERLPLSGTGPFTPPLGYLPDLRSGDALLWRREPNSKNAHGATRLRMETDETHSNFVGNIYFTQIAALAERACLKALRNLGGCPAGGFFATASRLDHLNEAMPGDTLEAEVWIFEINTASCTFDISVVNKSQGDMKIAAGRISYRLFVSVDENYEPQPMPEWLIPAIAEETL
jgi:enediyne polyketide synthase